MHKERIALILFSLTGMAATFFKWFSGVVPLPEEILNNSTGLDHYLNDGYALGTNLYSAGGWITFSVFALFFLLAIFKGERKNPLNLRAVLLLSVAMIFFILAKWRMEINPDFYTKLNDQMLAASDIAARAGIEGLDQLNLVPPHADLGLYIALASAVLILISGLIFRKSPSKK